MCRRLPYAHILFYTFVIYLNTPSFLIERLEPVTVHRFIIRYQIPNPCRTVPVLKDLFSNRQIPPTFYVNRQERTLRGNQREGGLYAKAQRRRESMAGGGMGAEREVEGRICPGIGLECPNFHELDAETDWGQDFVELAAPAEPGPCGTVLVAAEEALVGHELRVERGDPGIRLPRGATRAELVAVLQALRALP
jgi:hypothetical protein